MRESNQLHAICSDTYPPIYYMNETSRSIIKEATALNKLEGKNIVAYSIDAGFHVFLFVMKDNYERIMTKMTNSPLLHDKIDRFIDTSIGREGVRLI